MQLEVKHFSCDIWTKSHLSRVSISLYHKNLRESPIIKKKPWNMQSDFITVGGGRVPALIKDMCEYKQRNQERESVKAFGYHNSNGTAASAFHSSKVEQTIWRQLRMKTRKPCMDRCEDEPTPKISTTVVSGKTLKCQFLNIWLLFVILANGNPAYVNKTVS